MPVPVGQRTDAIAREIVDSAIKVHKTLGPGLLERTYQLCLAQELSLRGLAVRLEVPQPVVYEGLHLEGGYRIDLLVEESVVVEVKAVDVLNPVHTAQVAYLSKAFRQEAWAATELQR